MIDSWARPERLAQLLTFVVFPRNGVAKQRPGFRMVQVEASFDASSTEIRRRVRAGESAGEMVQPEVAEFIAERGLYLG